MSANGDVSLRLSGSWTGGKGGKQLTFSLRQLRFDLGGLKLDERKEEREDKKALRNRHGDAATRLAGDARVEKFNQAVTNLVAPRTGEFKKVADETAREEAAAKQDAKSSQPPNSLSVSYEVTAADKDFISVLFSFYEYLGGAHPNTTTESFNYDLNRNAPLSLADLFTPNSNYLKVISDYTIKELKKLDTVSGVENGAGPKIEFSQLEHHARRVEDHLRPLSGRPLRRRRPRGRCPLFGVEADHQAGWIAGPILELISTTCVR